MWWAPTMEKIVLTSFSGAVDFFSRLFVLRLLSFKFPSIIDNMNLTPIRPRAKAAIIAEINAIPYVVAGTLTEKRHTAKDGSTILYHQLQRWTEGQNETTYVKRENLERVKQGIENFKQRKRLLDELDEAGFLTAFAKIEQETHDKKKRPKPRLLSKHSSNNPAQGSGPSSSKRTRP
jgi:hypothetical protein